MTYLLFIPANISNSYGSNERIRIHSQCPEWVCLLKQSHIDVSTLLSKRNFPDFAYTHTSAHLSRTPKPRARIQNTWDLWMDGSGVPELLRTVLLGTVLWGDTKFSKPWALKHTPKNLSSYLLTYLDITDATILLHSFILTLIRQPAEYCWSTIPWRRTNVVSMLPKYPSQTLIKGIWPFLLPWTIYAKTPFYIYKVLHI